MSPPRRAAVALLLCAAAAPGCGNAPQPPAARGASAEEILAAHVEAVRTGRADAIQLDVPVTDDQLEQLAGLTGLKRLELSASQRGITDAGVARLAGLTDLEVLVLREAPLTDAGLESLQGLTRLKRLDATGTQLTDAGMARLAVAFPQLESLRIGGRHISDAGIAKLAALKHLRFLILVDTPVTDAVLPDIDGMQTLESFYLLGEHQVTDEGRAALRRDLHQH